MIAKGKRTALLNDKFSRAVLLALFFFSPRDIVVKLLNHQGRNKAQFITNAVLHYAGGIQTPASQGASLNSEQLRQLVCPAARIAPAGIIRQANGPKSGS